MGARYVPGRRVWGVQAEDTDSADGLSRLERLQLHESPEEALTRLTVDSPSDWDGWIQVGSRGGQYGEAQVCFIQRRYVHVVGASAMAQRLRELLAAGAAPGWALHPVPPGQTPLDLLAGPLLAASGAVRFYNLLLRSGFATAEEVAATPDEYLLDLRQSGPKMVAAVRQVLREVGLEAPEAARPAPAGEIAERFTCIMSLLSGPQRERYRDFAGMLARSSMPLAALSKVTESLGAEAVPPADPMVCLLLDTLGEAVLASYYRRTHAPPSEILPSADDPHPGRGPAVGNGQSHPGTPAD